MLSGQVPEQVPHWMQLLSCSQPDTFMISSENPRTRSASYLIVRLIFIISTSQIHRPLLRKGRGGGTPVTSGELQVRSKPRRMEAAAPALANSGHLLPSQNPCE
jgi:hypothetical protein